MLIAMSERDIQRFKVLNDLRDHRISQMDAADILHLSTRQVRRLLSLLNEQGASAFLINRLSTYL